MRRRSLLIVLSAVLLTGTVTAAAGPASGAKRCKPGVYKFDRHATARRFCGPGTAKVALTPVNTVKFRRGKCEKDAKYLTINLGTVVLGSTKKKRPEYFGLTIGRPPGSSGGKPARHDGTYDDGLVVVVHNDKEYDLDPSTVTLTNNRTRGTFSGTPFGGEGRISGSFRCR